MTTETTTEVPVPDINAVIAEAVRPWRQKVREAESQLKSIRDALVEHFKEETIEDLQKRRAFNEFLNNFGLQTVPRAITGNVEVVIRQTFYFEDLEIEDDADVDDAVTEWLKDEGHYSEYEWDLDSLDVTLDNDDE